MIAALALFPPNPPSIIDAKIRKVFQHHNRELDQAGDYFREAYGGPMVNLIGLPPVISAWDGK